MLSHEGILKRIGQSNGDLFRQAQQEDHSGVWIYLPDTGDFCWSRQIYSIYGVSMKTPLTQELFLSLVHDDDVAMAKAAFVGATVGKRYHFLHRIWVRGGIRWLEQCGRLYSGKNYPVPYLMGTVRDVTVMKEQETKLEERRADYAAITQYLAETTDTTNPSAIVSSLKRTIRKRMDVAIVAVFVREGEQISRVIPQQMDPMQAFLFQDIENFIGYRTVMTGKREVCPVEQYPSQLGRAAILEMGGKVITSMPIKHGGVTIGAMSVVTRSRGLTRREEEFCRTIRGYLSNQLNNALLYARLKKELELRVRMESDRDVIFNESVDFITIIDSDGRFTQINPSFADRLGFSQDALLGRSVFDFIHPEDRAYAWQVFSGLPAAGVIRGFRNRFLCRNGEIGSLENNLKYMPETKCTIAIARDLTGQLEMEERNNLLEEMVAFERTRSEFFTGLSHEFKTPLNIILASLDLVRLKSTREDAERFQIHFEKFFGYAYKNCYKLLRLTSNLLDAGRIENGYYQLHVVMLRLDELLKSVVNAAEIYASARGVSIDFCCELPDGVWLACDEDCVERILLNLLSNSIKNSRENGTVSVILTEEEEDFYQVTVEDDGAGIPAEVLPNVFDKFVTNRNPVSGQREGSGIGLTLVKSLTELHNGTVSAQSVVGVGSRFTFTLSKHLTLGDNSERSVGEAAVSLARLELADVR